MKLNEAIDIIACKRFKITVEPELGIFESVELEFGIDKCLFREQYASVTALGNPNVSSIMFDEKEHFVFIDCWVEDQTAAWKREHLKTA